MCTIHDYHYLRADVEKRCHSKPTHVWLIETIQHIRADDGKNMAVAVSFANFELVIRVSPKGKIEGVVFVGGGGTNLLREIISGGLLPKTNLASSGTLAESLAKKFRFEAPLYNAFDCTWLDPEVGEIPISKLAVDDENLSLLKVVIEEQRQKKVSETIQKKLDEEFKKFWQSN